MRIALAHILGIPVEENLPAIAAVGAAWLIILPALIRGRAARWRDRVRVVRSAFRERVDATRSGDIEDQRQKSARR